MNRTNTYIKTFPNTEAGQAEYKKLIVKIRSYFNGGTFVKMYRNGRRHRWVNTTLKKGSTHFDFYFTGNPTVKRP